MKIYTKTGDKGETGLIGGVRVPKDDLRIQTYGTLDELNATLGWALAQDSLPMATQARLLRIQNELFQLGAELATPRGRSPGSELIEELSIRIQEKEIDEMEGELPKLMNFILPGGSEPGALLHFSRTVCRRAERELVVLHRAVPVRATVLEYINRLSDYLFVSARWVNYKLGIKDVSWSSGRKT